VGKEGKVKNFAKFLLLAQAASDAGKGHMPSRASNAAKAINAGYGLKDQYIRQAIGEAKRLPHNVQVSVDFDGNLRMSVVLFDIQGFGQVSFHSFSDFSYVRNTGNGWNGIVGGEPCICKRLARKFNLPHYNKR
jgi:hypothetical protein